MNPACHFWYLKRFIDHKIYIDGNNIMITICYYITSYIC